MENPIKMDDPRGFHWANAATARKTRTLRRFEIVSGSKAWQNSVENDAGNLVNKTICIYDCMYIYVCIYNYIYGNPPPQKKNNLPVFGFFIGIYVVL